MSLKDRFHLTTGSGQDHSGGLEFSLTWPLIRAVEQSTTHDLTCIRSSGLISIACNTFFLSVWREGTSFLRVGWSLCSIGQRTFWQHRVSFGLPFDESQAALKAAAFMNARRYDYYGHWAAVLPLNSTCLTLEMHSLISLVSFMTC